MVQPGGRRRVRALAGAIALGLVSAVCSGACGGADGGVALDEARRSGTSSSPITAEVPDDWRLVAAGVGTRQQSWGQECCNPDEPYTVVWRSDEDRYIFLNHTGYEGAQGGFDTMVLGDPLTADNVEVNGRRALLSQGAEPAASTGLRDLVIDLDGTSALHVTGIDATSDELTELGSAAIVDDAHHDAPRFDELPSGFELVGSVNAAGVVALEAVFFPGTDTVPGDDSAHALGWTIGSGERSPNVTTVAALAVPPGTITLDALALDPPVHRPARKVEEATVDGRRALEITEGEPGREPTLTLVTDTAWGDQVVISARSGVDADAPPGFEQLSRVAASVEQADAGAWDRLVEGASGGPGLTANVGHQEVARGEAAGLEWLLQTGGHNTGDLGPVDLDECLKLSDGTSACPIDITGEADDDGRLPGSVAIGPLGPDRLPFVIMVVPGDDPAVELRFTGDDLPETAPFRPLPDTDAKVAVLVGEQGDRLECAGPDQPPGPLERLDADGTSLGCPNF